MVELLKFGALGIGMAILAYSAALLKQELGRPSPRKTARQLITTFMIFGLLAFGAAGYLEVKERQMNSLLEVEALASKILAIANSLDANLGGKFQSTVTDLPPDSNERRNLVYFTKALCGDVRRLKEAVETKTSGPAPEIYLQCKNEP